MNYNILLPLLGVSFVTGCNSSSKPSEKKQPNIILIMADDMGFECVGAFGSTSYQTPRLDRLAEEGILAENCIANPLCTPSRVKIMTGMHNYRNYEHFGYLNPNQYTFGNMMKEAGYKTMIAGKWQLNGIYHDKANNLDPERPFHFGFDEFCLWQVNKGKNLGERYADPLILQNGEELPRNPDSYGPDIFSNYIIDFIDRNRDTAFFVYYPMVLVHDPFVPTPDSPEWSDPDRRYENDTSYFRDMVAYSDKIVGRILDKLEVEGLAENTLVIFTGDNGTNRSITSQTHNRSITGGKGKTIDYGVHTPLIMRWPAMIKQGEVYSGPIEFSDFFATFAEITGSERQCDGVSFLGLLKGNPYPARELAFVNYDPMWGQFVNQHRNRFVQDTMYKLYQDDKMYNIVADPLELNQLDNIEVQQLGELHTRMKEILDEKPAWKQ